MSGERGERPIRLSSGGRSLDARLSRPEGSPRGSVAVAHPHPAHGGHMDHSAVRAVADAAVAAGLAALRFDFGGVRESEGDVSDREAHLEDLVAAAARAREEAPDGTALGAGYSYGARAWAEALVRPGAPSVRGLLLLAPPTRVPRTSRDFGDLLLGRPLRAASVDESVVEALLRARVPTRILVGSEDVVAPPSGYASLRPPVEVRVLPGLDHFFARGRGAGAPASEALAAAIRAALVELLPAAPGSAAG